MNTALIATTYNQPVDLDLFLKSLKAQTDQSFKIYIADDGSATETRKIIEKHRDKFFLKRLHHIWHEDEGYRKTKILNSAIRESSEEWLIFTDSDLIVHPKFIEDHKSVASKNTLFMGRRVDLNAETSNKIRGKGSPNFNFEFYLSLITSKLSSNPIHNLNRSFRVSNPFFSRLLGMGRVPDLLGSNFSIHRELLHRINGFNENLEHYWGEDGDLFVRARNDGAKIFGRKSFAVQFHLWHEFRKPKPDAESWYAQLLNETNYVRCDKGLLSK